MQSFSLSVAGLLDNKSRLKNIKRLYLRGTEISDVSLRYVAQYLHHLIFLDVSSCWKISNDGLAQLSMGNTKIMETLQTIEMSGCKQVSNQGLQNLSLCPNLSYVDCSGTRVNNEGLRKFIDASPLKLKLSGTAVICKRLSAVKKEMAAAAAAASSSGKQS